AGAGGRLVGVVEYSDHPAQARRIARIGDAFRIDLERVAALRPDIVLAWESGTAAPTIERLESLGLSVLSIRTQRLADVADAIRTIGDIAGTQAQAAAAAADYEARIGDLRARYAGRRQLRVFVQVNDRPIYTVNDAQIISEIVALCGGRNVFADLDQLAPVVSVEAVIAANPEAILVTDVARGAEQSWLRWKSIAAVRAQNVYVIPADDVARPTIRLADGVAHVCRTLDTARARLAAGR